MIGQKGMPAIYGGVERHVHDLSVRLVKAGHEVTVYSRSWYTKSKDTTIDGVSIAHVPSIHTKHWDTISHVFLATFHALFGRYDVIHYHGVGPALASWIPRIFAPRTRVITTFHSIDRYHAKWNSFAKFTLRLGEHAACMFAHRTIAISRSIEQYCLKEFGKQTDYIPNAVANDMVPYTTKALSAFHLEKGAYLAMVTRLIPHKGAHLLIEAFANLKTKYANHPKLKGLKLAIVGGSAYTDEYVKSLHTQASACNDIVFTGFQSDEALHSLFLNAKALVHPSMNEGLPITVMEAMSYRVPVLLSSIAEHIELVKDVRMIFNENDVSALEECIMNFLELDAVTVDAIREENSKMIEEHYSWRHTVPQIIALYEKKKGAHQDMVQKNQMELA